MEILELSPEGFRKTQDSSVSLAFRSQMSQDKYVWQVEISALVKCTAGGAIADPSVLGTKKYQVTTAVNHGFKHSAGYDDLVIHSF